MSVHIERIVYHSKGTDLLYTAAKCRAEAFSSHLISTLVAGGLTPTEAVQIASDCKLSSAMHQFKSIQDQKTVVVRMTKEEYETMRQVSSTTSAPL